MTDFTRERLTLLAVLLVAGAVFLPGINWGLPSRAVDPYLFGDEPVWPGAKIAALAPSDANVLGADVDANPLAARDRPVILNQTDAQRAEIIRRYRLFSYQPDEMITFKSLAQIRTHRGDPRLYQYGGLWIYPVGALLGAADLIGFIDLRGGAEGQVFYLDHPEAFGRFYLIARLYAAAWGLVAVGAIFRILRRISADVLIAAAGAVAFACMPVVVTMAHEAKPHLPGLALMLLAVLAAARYIETGHRGLALLAGGLCGAAFGMVISSLLAFAILPVMVLLRRGEPPRARLLILALATAAGLLVYALTNPFVPINAFRQPQVLSANLGNSTAMYAISLGGIGTALKLLAAGGSLIILAAGAVGLAVLLIFRRDRRDRRHRRDRPPVLWLLLAPAALVTIQFILLADGKPPEYARFGLATIALLLVAAVSALGLVPSRPLARAAAVALALLTSTSGLPYVAAFVRDASPPTSRLAAAQRLAQRADAGARTIRLFAEPAPYIAPPLNLFRHRIVYAPSLIAVDADVTLALDPTDTPAPISWADVGFVIEPAPAPAVGKGGAVGK